LVNSWTGQSFWKKPLCIFASTHPNPPKVWT